MEDNMVMENVEVTEDVTPEVPEEAYECETCESSGGFGSGMIGGVIATGAILGGIALIKKIKAKRAAKKAAKEAAEEANEEANEAPAHKAK